MGKWHQSYLFASILFFTVGGLCPSFAEEAIDLQQLNFLALECFSGNQLERCQKALVLSETLQSKARLKKKYACQTLALGLGADLILYQNKVGRGREAIALLEEVNSSCKGI